ncbi:unnamed protein product, partial [marine sediment metagenome]
MKMIIKVLVIITILTFPLVIGTQVSFAFQYGNWDLGGYLRHESSLKVGDDTVEPMWFENILQLELTYHLNENIDFFLMTRGYYDAVYDAKNGGFLKEHRVRKDLRDKYSHHRKDTLADAIREAYIDIFLEDFDIRIGKQQIVWGKTEGFKMLDIINPTDYRKFVQDVFEDSRITLWSAKIDYAIGLNNLLELVIIPD